ncbi:MAG: Gmad2 immunoglobulin-like domain-containing protein [Chloroflexota bacterium]
MRLKLLLTLSLLLLTPACSVVSDLITPTPTLLVIQTETPTPVPQLTEAALKNATYTLTGFDGSSAAYQFVDGKYNHATDPAAPDFVDIRLLDFLPFGDLNEDGFDDAAVLIAANYGGTGVFVTLAAVLNVDGQPRHVASTTVDDRPQINALEIRDGTIILDAVVHSFDDPGCCPTFAVTRAYKIVGPSLTLVNAASQTPAGRPRVIAIEEPLDGAEVSGALVIRGNVTIAPFENNLSFRAYTEQGNELSSGPVPVTAPDLGAPGTFAVTLDLSAFPPGRLYIEIADLSAADGSVLALATVMVVVR